MTEPHPLRVAFARRHPAELATWLASQTQDVLVQALDGIPADAGGAVIARLPHAVAVRLLAGRDDETVSAWLARANLDDALALVLHLEPQRRARLLARLPIRHMRRTLERLVIYPARTVGALVDPTVPRVTVRTTLRDAIAMLRADDEPEPARVWLVDDEGRFRGLLDAGRALVARSDRLPVGELATAATPLRAETALAAARRVPEWVRHPELPVVDHLGHLLGALTHQRLLEALQDDTPAEAGVLDAVAGLAHQYFRVMGIALGDLLALGGRR